MDYSSYYLDARRFLEASYKEILKRDFNSSIDNIDLTIVSLRLMKAMLIAQTEEKARDEK